MLILWFALSILRWNPSNELTLCQPHLDRGLSWCLITEPGLSGKYRASCILSHINILVFYKHKSLFLGLKCLSAAFIQSNLDSSWEGRNWEINVMQFRTEISAEFPVFLKDLGKIIAYTLDGVFVLWWHLPECLPWRNPVFF